MEGPAARGTTVSIRAPFASTPSSVNSVPTISTPTGGSPSLANSPTRRIVLRSSVSSAGASVAQPTGLSAPEARCTTNTEGSSSAGRGIRRSSTIGIPSWGPNNSHPKQQTWDTVVQSKKCGENLYALSPSVHGGASAFGLGGGAVAISVACGQQRPGHDAQQKSRVLQRHLRSLAKRAGRPVCWLETTTLPTTPLGTLLSIKLVLAWPITSRKSRRTSSQAAALGQRRPACSPGWRCLILFAGESGGLANGRRGKRKRAHESTWATK